MPVWCAVSSGLLLVAVSIENVEQDLCWEAQCSGNGEGHRKIFKELRKNSMHHDEERIWIRGKEDVFD